MPDLIAQGAEPQQRWRRSLPPGETIVLGRAHTTWAVPWDSHVSRQHAEVRLRGDRLEVARLADAQNPIFFQGAEVDRCELAAGGHFVIGETMFTFADQQVTITSDAPEPVRQQTFTAQYLKGVSFRDPNRQIEVLSRLPEAISGAAGDKELCVRLVSMLLAGIPRASAAAIVTVEDAADDATPVEVLHWDQRMLIGNPFAPSDRLIRGAVGEDQGVLHIWRGAAADGEERFTEHEAFDWACCTPVPGAPGEHWALYVAGRFEEETRRSDVGDLREAVKFSELVGGMLGSLRRMRLLQRQQAGFSQFFSPVVLETLAVDDPDVVLAPRETDVSVLFCDLQGFSRESERSAGDLLGLLERVSETLGVATRHIRRQGGVVGDFHGDAAMGFWGWPLAQEDAILRTVTAALAVQGDFEAIAQRADHPLADFRAGIGIATGPAVAGKIGTIDQVKVTVFGPVVNLASRLESMTRILHARILLDEPTAAAVRRDVPEDIARVRRLAVVKPYGLETPVEVSELLPPVAECPEPADEHLARYQSALDAFLAGDWVKALELLDQIPSADRAKDFLSVYITQHDRTPPDDWNGVIVLESK